MQQTSHWDLSDQAFSQQFSDCTLDPFLFTHQAHIRLAWIYITQYGIDVASQRLCAEIARFDKVHGDGTKFNMTVTIAAARAVDHFMRKSNSSDFADFSAEFPRLLTNFKDLIGQHYGWNIFADSRAKISYLEPDLAPFT